MLRVTEHDINRIFQEASGRGDREWVLEDGAAVRKLPQVRYFGLRLPYASLAEFGKLMLRGHSRYKAAHMAGITEGSARRFMERANIPNLFREHCKSHTYRGNMRSWDILAHIRAVQRYAQDRYRWEQAAADGHKAMKFTNAREQLEYLRFVGLC